jgi:hypothetical protein
VVPFKEGCAPPDLGSRGDLRFAPRKILFIIFVDAIFTTSFERPFTNVFDVTGAKSANDCVCRARHAG